MPISGDTQSLNRHLTDNELLARTFDAADPESLEGITDDPPRGGQPAVEYVYDLRQRGERARCSFCGRSRNHYIGVVALYATGERALVGRNCAIDHLGADFQVLLNDFDAARERQGYLRRRNAVIAARDGLKTEMRELIEHPVVETFGRLRREWRDLMGSMAPALTAAARAGALRTEKWVRDEAAEAKRLTKFVGLPKAERRAEKRAARFRGELDPIRRWIVNDLGPIRGAAFFFADDSVSTKLREADAKMREVLLRLGADDIHTRDMRECMVALGACRDLIEAEMGRLASTLAAFDLVNLANIAVWANERAESETPKEPPIPEETLAWHRTPASRPQSTFGRFHESNRAFHRTEGRQTWTVELPAWFSVPQPAVLGTLRRVLAIS